MKEYIFDLRNLIQNDEVCETFADHPARVEAEGMLLDHRGKKIRVRVTEIR